MCWEQERFLDQNMRRYQNKDFYVKLQMLFKNLTLQFKHVLSKYSLYLGIIVDDKGEMINHRSMLKVFVNPVLRMFGVNIVTILEEDGHMKRLDIIPCERTRWIQLRRYQLPAGARVIPTRRIW